jgi:hypothetical protein
MDERPVSQVPWSSTHGEFLATAKEVSEGGAVTVFVIDETIPAKARPGYAALVVAYARAAEPVTIFDDGGAAILIREGGVDSGKAAAARVLGQLKRLNLETTLRAGVAGLEADVDATIANARAAAQAAAPGETGTAG